jgi:type II secretory pathway component PulF
MGFYGSAFDSFRRLSAEETADLAVRVAELTRAGLPLGAGLRGLADESSSRRLARVLRRLADDLDAGVDLPGALESHGRRLPPFFCGLVVAGLRSGRLAETMVEYAEAERSRLELRRRVWLSLAYPLGLLVLLTLLAVAARTCGVGEYVRLSDVCRDWGVGVPFFTALLVGVSGVLVWLLVCLSGTLISLPLLRLLAGGARWTWCILYRVPMIGPLLRWSYLAQFCRMMALLLERQMPVPEALRLAASSLRDVNLAGGCRRVADEVERGRPLDESMGARRQFPAGMIPLVERGQRTSTLADAFRGAAEAMDARACVQGALFEAILLPAVFLLVAFSVGVFFLSVIWPIVSMWMFPMYYFFEGGRGQGPQPATVVLMILPTIPFWITLAWILVEGRR